MDTHLRFTLVKNLKKDTHMSNILKGLLFFILLYLISDFFVKYFTIGLLPDALLFSFMGNEEEYIEPMGIASFLELWHTEIFFIMMILLTLSAIYIRVVSNVKHYKFTLNVVMISALISLVSLPLAFYVSQNFIYIYFITYFLWHLGAIKMTLRSLWKLYA